MNSERAHEEAHAEAIKWGAKRSQAAQRFRPRFGMSRNLHDRQFGRITYKEPEARTTPGHDGEW